VKGTVFGLMEYPTFISLSVKLDDYRAASVTVPVPVVEARNLRIGARVDVVVKVNIEEWGDADGEEVATAKEVGGQ
jgi:hypothetical protein